mmetsp:Transcript_22142/g.71385  ORF Transcript_22142/g.71385 Transcript_22142/m.71385 type:complete len:379 (+) Transcript_22142:925-2061(+)
MRRPGPRVGRRAARRRRHVAQFLARERHVPEQVRHARGEFQPQGQVRLPEVRKGPAAQRLHRKRKARLPTESDVVRRADGPAGDHDVAHRRLRLARRRRKGRRRGRYRRLLLFTSGALYLSDVVVVVVVEGRRARVPREGFDAVQADDRLRRLRGARRARLREFEEILLEEKKGGAGLRFSLSPRTERAPLVDHARPHRESLPHLQRLGDPPERAAQGRRHQEYGHRRRQAYCVQRSESHRGHPLQPPAHRVRGDPVRLGNPEGPPRRLQEAKDGTPGHEEGRQGEKKGRPPLRRRPAGRRAKARGRRKKNEKRRQDHRRQNRRHQSPRRSHRLKKGGHQGQAGRGPPLHEATRRGRRRQAHRQLVGKNQKGRARPPK